MRAAAEGPLVDARCPLIGTAHPPQSRFWLKMTLWPMTADAKSGTLQCHLTRVLCFEKLRQMWLEGTVVGQREVG